METKLTMREASVLENMLDLMKGFDEICEKVEQATCCATEENPVVMCGRKFTSKLNFRSDAFKQAVAFVVYVFANGGAE